MAPEAGLNPQPASHPGPALGPPGSRRAEGRGWGAGGAGGLEPAHDVQGPVQNETRTKSVSVAAAEHRPRSLIC